MKLQTTHNFGNVLRDFQEYKLIVEKLREAYFENTTNLDAIRSDNIALLSDLHMVDRILKMAILQTNANNIGTNRSQHKNTFLYR